jgi:hypothetical protein
MTETCASKKRTQFDLSWEQCLKDGTEALKEAKNDVKAIQRSLRIIRSKIRKGEPFPVDRRRTTLARRVNATSTHR